ncbi:MAG: hypothetical protein NTU54_05730 [Candidatus Omnitrophica bacterium]|nr:hypothetical protein [Candidatus Omnitrophota bacterium]
MDKKFHIDILAADKVIYRGEVISLVAPGELGYLGVLANHAPIIARLTSGRIILKDTFGKREIFKSQGSGFLEVVKNRAVILLDS